MSAALLDEIRDLTSRIRDLEDDLEGAISVAVELGFTPSQILGAQERVRR